MGHAELKVFGGGVTCLRPHLPTRTNSSLLSSAQVNGELQKRADDMLGEVAITKTLSALGDEDAAGEVADCLGRGL